MRLGSTFYFIIWLGIGSQPGAGNVVPERLNRLRALVVDDNPSARQILEEALSTIVSHVDTVASGKEAIAVINEQDSAMPYDVVFMDWRMPGLDGLQVSRHIKADEVLRHQPALVLVTAFGREEVREEAEHLQLDGYLLKPVSKSMLVDALINIFAEVNDFGKPTIRKQPEQDNGGLAGAQILVVEDNEINQQIAVELLEGAGASVKVASNGKQAVALLTAGVQPPPFHLVLMDVQMPALQCLFSTDAWPAFEKLVRDYAFIDAQTELEEALRRLSAS